MGGQGELEKQHKATVKLCKVEFGRAPVTPVVTENLKRRFCWRLFILHPSRSNRKSILGLLYL